MRISVPRRKKRRYEFICIACPLGCMLTVRAKAGVVLSVTGNRCKKGVTYAEQEVASPQRIVTTTVRLEGGRIGLLPVRTRAPVARGAARDVVRAASRIVVHAPVRLGDTVLEDVSGTGVGLVATRGCEAVPAGGDGPPTRGEP